MNQPRTIKSIRFYHAQRLIKGAAKEQHQDIVCAVCHTRDTDGTIFHATSLRGNPLIIPLCRRHDHQVRLPRARILYHHMTSW